MSRQRRNGPQLDLNDLPSDVCAALEAAVAGDGVTLTRSGVRIGSLEFRPIVLEGTVIDGPAKPVSPAPVAGGVTVVATAMPLLDTARRRLSDELGGDYIVLDVTEAPASADVLLTHPISLQLLGHLRQQFPLARVVVTEIDDEELGVRYPGPVSRLLDAGVSAYLPPRPIAELAANVHAYLTQGGEPMLESADRPPQAHPAAQPRQIDR